MYLGSWLSPFPHVATSFGCLARMLHHLAGKYIFITITTCTHTHTHMDGRARMHTHTHLQAMRLVEFLMYKGSYGIASFYFSLKASSKEHDSPPSHYQLLSQVKDAGEKVQVLWFSQVDHCTWFVADPPP